MALVKRQKIRLFSWMLLCCLFCSEPHLSYGLLEFPWCPPEEYACSCSLREDAAVEDESGSGTEIPMLISCDSTNIQDIIGNIPTRLASDLEIHVRPGSGDRVLPSLGFFNFSMLRHLDLSRNSLEYIEAGAFHNAVELTRLNLSHNFLYGLTYDTFSGVLVISNSSVQYGLPKLKELMLDNNDIAFIHDDVFGSLAALRFLDLSGNRISEISNFTFSGLHGLTVLHLAGNFIQNINSSMWEPLYQVREMNLSDNQITEVVPDSFKNMSHLLTLRLDKNRIEDILEPGLETPSVNNLNLSHNSISHVSFNFIHEKSQNLTWINLNNNLITSINHGSWSSLILQELYLNDNDIGNIANGFLWGISDLIHLEMKNNRIHSVNQYMLGDLPNLMVLNLDNNEISYLSDDIFEVEYDPRQRGTSRPPSNLRKFYINNNRLRYPCTDVIAQMPGMHVYSMNQNTILKLRSFDLPDHQALADIDLSTNQIYAITSDAFANLPALSRVDLKGNRLQTLSRDVFETLPTFLFLGSNPLVCDCNLAWLQESAIDNVDDVRCAAPKALESMAVSSLVVSDFHCSIEANMNSSNEFAGVHGQGVLLECPVMSANKANVQWFIAAYNHTSRSMVLEDVTQTGDVSTRITNYPNGSIYIHTVSHEQNTNYTCRATNNVDERDFLILLRVEGSNGTGFPGGKDGKDDDDDYRFWKTDIMKYAIGGAAGAVFLIGLMSILLAFFLSTKRLQKMTPRDSCVKELPINNKQYEERN